MVPVYTTAHQDMTGVLGCHRQTPREGLGREGGGGQQGTSLFVYEHCCPLLASKEIKPEEIVSGRARIAAACARMQGRWEMLSLMMFYREICSFTLPADVHAKSSQPLGSC